MLEFFRDLHNGPFHRLITIITEDGTIMLPRCDEGEQDRGDEIDQRMQSKRGISEVELSFQRAKTRQDSPRATSSFSSVGKRKVPQMNLENKSRSKVEGAGRERGFWNGQ